MLITSVAILFIFLIFATIMRNCTHYYKLSTDSYYIALAHEGLHLLDEKRKIIKMIEDTKYYLGYFDDVHEFLFKRKKTIEARINYIDKILKIRK